MIHGYGCLASNTCQQFLLRGCLVIQLFWCGAHLLTFISVLPPPTFVTEQMSQYLMVLASSFLWWVGAREDGALSSLKRLSVVLSKCPENGRRLVTFLRMNIQEVFTIDKAKGKGALVQ